MAEMNGAKSLLATFVDAGVEVCFTNPGTSEMHFVAALDDHPEMRCVLCLFEGGTTGAADGYFRMKRDVAGTLLHLAPGFGNAFANLHNEVLSIKHPARTASSAGGGTLASAQLRAYCDRESFSSILHRRHICI